MDPPHDMHDDFDYSHHLQMVLSQLNGDEPAYPMDVGDVVLDDVHFPKPADMAAMADAEDIGPPPTTHEIIEDILENVDNYPKTLQILMLRGLLKKKQQCKKCEKPMHLRRRKCSYEWRCRTKDKKGDCSSCSIKSGSWFENTKLSFKIIFNVLVMHCKNYSSGHMSSILKLSTHSINEARRMVHELTDRIASRYPRIGEKTKDVYLEIITIKGKNDVYKVLAGQEIGTNHCFAAVLNDCSAALIERIKTVNVDPHAKVTMVKTVKDDDPDFASVAAIFFDEKKYYAYARDQFFCNLRENPEEHFLSTRVTLQSWLNDQVVRKTEGIKMMEKCVEELKTFTSTKSR
ncbi:unnamed protein product [Caenorhabditis nigoni]